MAVPARTTLRREARTARPPGCSSCSGARPADPALDRDGLAEGIGARQPGGRRDERRPDRRSGGGQRDRAVPRRGDVVGIPAFVHEEYAPPMSGSRGDLFQKSIGAVASFDPGPRRSGRRTIRRRCSDRVERWPCAVSTSPGTRAGARRGDVRRGPVPCRGAGWPTSRPRGHRPRHGIVATAKHLVGHGLRRGRVETRRPRTSGRASRATSNCCRSRRRVREAGYRQRHARVLNSTAFPVTYRTSSGRRSFATSGGRRRGSPPTTRRSRCCRRAPPDGSDLGTGQRRWAPGRHGQRAPSTAAFGDSASSNETRRSENHARTDDT